MNEVLQLTASGCRIAQDQLQAVTFPIGGMTKANVRAAAHRLNLPNRARKDSQGICFLGQVNYDSFLRLHLGDRPGEILEEETGQLVGEHRGLWFHTVGQRKGIGPVLTNTYRALGPWHVVRKDFDKNRLYASRSYESADKRRDEFDTVAISWVAGAPPRSGCGPALRLQVKVRHGAECHWALVFLGKQGDTAHVKLAVRDKGLAPGQFAAFYDGDECLGSGVISESNSGLNAHVARTSMKRRRETQSETALCLPMHATI